MEEGGKQEKSLDKRMEKKEEEEGEVIKKIKEKGRADKGKGGGRGRKIVKERKLKKIR